MKLLNVMHWLVGNSICIRVFTGIQEYGGISVVLEKRESVSLTPFTLTALSVKHIIGASSRN
jgi:hypothetical protein